MFLLLFFHPGKDIIAWIANKLKITPEGTLPLITKIWSCSCAILWHLPTVHYPCLRFRGGGSWHHVSCIWIHLPPSESQETGHVQRCQSLSFPGMTKLLNMLSLYELYIIVFLKATPGLWSKCSHQWLLDYQLDAC